MSSSSKSGPMSGLRKFKIFPFRKRNRAQSLPETVLTSQIEFACLPEVPETAMRVHRNSDTNRPLFKVRTSVDLELTLKVIGNHPSRLLFFFLKKKLCNVCCCGNFQHGIGHTHTPCILAQQNSGHLVRCSFCSSAEFWRAER